MNMMTFVLWQEYELQRRAWSHAELARRGCISPAQISRVSNREQNPGPKYYRAIAKAFHMPLDHVMNAGNSFQAFQ